MIAENGKLYYSAELIGDFDLDTGKLERVREKRHGFFEQAAHTIYNDNKLYYECMDCGKRFSEKSCDNGLFIDFSLGGNSGRTQLAICGKCARKSKYQDVAEKLFDVFDIVNNAAVGWKERT